jgi:PAS domain S-box-containing protein
MELVSIGKNLEVNGKVTFEKGCVNLDAPNFNLELKDYSDIIKVGNALGYDVDIYVPVNNCDDFIVNSSYQLTKLGYYLGQKLDQNLYQNKSIFKMFPFLSQLGYLNLYKRVIEEDLKFNHNLHFNVDDSTTFVLFQSFFKFDNNVVVITKETNGLSYDEKYENYLFNNSNNGLVTIQNGNFVAINDEFLRMFNYSRDDVLNKPVNIIEDYSNEIYREKDLYTKKTFMEDYNKVLYHDILTATGLIHLQLEGNEKWLRIYLVPSIFNNNPAVQISFFDVTVRKLSEIDSKLVESNLNTLLDLSKFAISEGAADFMEWSDQIYSILDVDSKDYPEGFDFLKGFVLPEDYETMIRLIKNKIEVNPDQKIFNVIDFPLRAKTKKGVIKYLSISLEIFLDDNRKFNKFIIFVQDKTDFVSYEKRILEANQNFESSIKEKEVLLKEVHHRVKNNLQIIVSLLTLDSRFNNNPELTLEATKNRISSMALIHEKIYNSDDLSHINIKDYIISEVNSLFNLYHISNIKIHYDLEEIDLTMEKAIPLGLIINEIVHNTIKYAFPNGEEGNLRVSLNLIDNQVHLVMADDGIGLPDDLDIYNSPSLGLTIINSLVRQLEGEFYKIDQKGAAFGIDFDLN